MPGKKKNVSFEEAVRRAVKLNSDAYDLPFTLTIAMRIVYAAEQGDIDAARLIYDILKDSPKAERKENENG